MQIDIKATANMTQASSQFAAVTAQVAAMNAELAKSSMIPQGGNPAGFARAARAANGATMAYNQALASSGAFRVEQLKINDAVSKNTELLQRQKLGFRETFGKKSRSMMQAVYREQLAMQQSIARVSQSPVGDGKTRMSLAVPTEVHSSWDTLNNRVGMFRERLSSASSEMLNWGKNTQWAGRQLMAGISMPVAAFGAAAGYMAYTVDKELTRVAKVYDTTADQNSQNIMEQMSYEKELAQVRSAGMKTAVDAAGQYGSAVSETLEVQAELAATGQTGMRLQESTNQVMRIATLGEVDHANATKALIALQATLGHSTKQTADDFNYLNSIENATSLSTNDFIEAIPRALGPMKEMGGSLQDLAILMVAMKERGVAAGEGANAIKSMMQRLYRPSQQVRAEWEQLAGVDPLAFVEESGGNVMEILPKIAEATKDLDKASRVKLLAGLFGTYQVSRMSSMLKGLDDMKNGVGQTTRVLEVNQQSMEQWAATADKELSTQAESASGKFKRAWESMRAELAVIGEPFLEVASKFLTLTSSVLGFFNGMPEWAKKGAIFGLILAAIVGPVVMLIGLFANFAANMGKFVAWSLRSVTSFRLMTKAQYAAKISADMAQQALLKEATAVEMLSAQMRGLTIAAETSAVAMSRLAGIPLPAAVANSIDARRAQPSAGPAPVNIGMPGGLTSTPERMSSSTMYNGARITNRESDSEYSQRVRQAEQLSSIERERLHHQTRIGQQAEAERRIRERTRNSISGAGLAMGAMGASAALMMLDINDTTNSIAKWVMIGSLVVPATVMLVKLLVQAGGAAKIFVAAQWASVTAARAQAVATASTLPPLIAARTAAMGLAASLWAATGPVALIAAGLLAAGAAFYFINKRNKEIREEQIKQVKQQAELTNLTEKWATATGKAGEGYRKLKGVMTTVKDQTQFDADVEFYRGDEQKGARDAYSQLNKDQKKASDVQAYIDLLKEAGLTATEAEANMVAFYYASGKSMEYAQKDAAALRKSVGEVSEIDWSKQMKTLSNNMINSTEELMANGDTQKIDALGMDMGGVFWESFMAASEKGPKQARKAFEKIEKVSLAQWEKLRQRIIEEGNSGANISLDGLAFNSAEAQEMLSTAKGVQDFYNSLDGKWKEEAFGVIDSSGGINKELTSMASGAASFEKALADGIGTASDLGTEFSTIDQLLNELAVKSATMTLEEQQEDALAMTEFANKRNNALEYGNYLERTYAGFTKEITDEERLATINTYNKLNGLKESEYVSVALFNLTNGIRAEIGGSADEAKRLANNMAFDVPDFDGENMKTMLQSGYEGVQQDLSDMLTSNFERDFEAQTENIENTWDSAIENLEKSQERASERMDNRHEAEQERFENRWEARTAKIEKGYDIRIEKVNQAIEAEQKAEEIRQKIFEAEQTRLDRLTDAANRTIDFNMAMQTGDLDEAAKIRNDMDAKAQEWALSDAASAGGTASERRQAKLEKKGENIGEEKDAALKAMEKREEQEAKSLERRQEREKKHLDEVQEMNMKSLEAQAEAAKKSFEAEWEARRDSLDDQLETFKSFIPKNQKQLKAWMKTMGIDYENFGLDILKPKSEKWGKWFNNSLRNSVKEAGRSIASDNMWETMGADVARQTLLGMGFGSMNKFKNFIMTGKLPDDFGKVNKKEPKSRSYSTRGGRDLVDLDDVAPGLMRHTGGWVDDSPGSRKGVARTTKGVGPGETTALLRKKEFVVNEHSAKRYGTELEAMNKGIYDSTSTMGGAGGAGSGLSGLISGAMGTMLSVGIARAFENAIVSKYKQVQAASSFSGQGFPGSFGNINAGDYGGTAFSAEQLANAQAIASVGRSLGASSRDIVIALMTAMQESTLRNLDYGDRDSVGLFQQRDAWGSFAARTNPEESARMFFLGGAQGQRGLFDFPDRASMSLSEAAQSVQVSAYPDAYAKWADEAKSIFQALSNSGSSGYKPGKGGKHVPIKAASSRNLHGAETGYPAYDFAVPRNTPIYAVSDGVISRSYDIPGPLASDSYRGDGPYGSYGKVIYLKTDAGPEVLYAHLNQRSVSQGDRVAGGAVIGRSGNTGNSSGPHLHFGATNGPLAWLKSGGQTINDGIAMLHRGETVLTKPLTDDLNSTVRAFGKSSKEILSGRRGGNREGQMERAKKFARDQVGKPYIWGGVGPNGFDCSGLQSAIVNIIKGNKPFSRLFATGSMAGVIPNLGFKRGNGGKSDYSVGWRTGSPGHTSGRIGDMPIESTGNAVRSQGATPVGAFPNQWHLPMTSIAAQTSTNPNGIDTKGKDKTPVVPWTKKDGFNSTTESWSEDNMKAQQSADNGFWTWISGMMQKAAQKAIGASKSADSGSSGGSLRTGTYNLHNKTGGVQRNEVKSLMGRADLLGLTDFTGGGKSDFIKWLASQGWGHHGPKGDSSVVWNKEMFKFMRGGTQALNPNHKRTRQAYGNYAVLNGPGGPLATIAAHTAAHTGDGGSRGAYHTATQREQFASLTGMVNRLSDVGPVILMGDLNEDLRQGKIDIADLKSNWAGNMKGRGTHGSRFIDHIMTSGLSLSGTQVVGGLSSDHNAALAQYNIPSRKNGAENIRWDNTLVNMHKKESILTADQSDKFRKLANNIDDVAGGAGNEYNVNVYITEPGADADEITNKVVTALKKIENRKPTRRRS